MNETQTPRPRVPAELACPRCGNDDPARILIASPTWAGPVCEQCGCRYQVLDASEDAATVC